MTAMTDAKGRPTVSTYYDTEGITQEAIEDMDKRILAIGGPGCSPQYGIDSKRRFTWSCETLAESSALSARLKDAGFPAVESVTGSRTR
jgi:hypothetical protein